MVNTVRALCSIDLGIRSTRAHFYTPSNRISVIAPTFSISIRRTMLRGDEYAFSEMATKARGIQAVEASNSVSGVASKGSQAG